MIENLLINTKQGFFVWSSFTITILACYLFFLKTRKTLKKYEKDFASEIEKLSLEDRKLVLAKSKIANQVIVSQNKIA